MVGPGASRPISCIPPTASLGRMAMARTIIPMPPNHWLKLLQKSIPLGRASISINTVAPVVVNPATDSNHASTGLPKTP